MSVENLTRPISIGKTGVMLPCTIACTAIGMKGVVVAALVFVIAGDGVITKNVGVSSTEVGVSLGMDRTVEVAEAGTLVFIAVFGTLIAGLPAGRFMKSKAAATATERTPTTRDQRARTTYRCRIR
jgi:hypothetical protein